MLWLDLDIHILWFSSLRQQNLHCNLSNTLWPGVFICNISIICTDSGHLWINFLLLWLLLWFLLLSFFLLLLSLFLFFLCVILNTLNLLLLNFYLLFQLLICFLFINLRIIVLLNFFWLIFLCFKFKFLLLSQSLLLLVVFLPSLFEIWLFRESFEVLILIFLEVLIYLKIKLIYVCVSLKDKD